MGASNKNECLQQCGLISEPNLLLFYPIQTFCFVSTILFISVAIFMLICFVINDWIWTSAFNQAQQTEAEPNELDEQEPHANEESISLIA